MWCDISNYYSGDEKWVKVDSIKTMAVGDILY